MSVNFLISLSLRVKNANILHYNFCVSCRNNQRKSQINGRGSKTDICNVPEHYYYLPKCTPFSLKCNFRCCEETDVCLLWVDAEEESHFFLYILGTCLPDCKSVIPKDWSLYSPPWNLQIPSYKPKWKDSVLKWITGSCTVDVKEAEYLVGWCWRGKGPVVVFCDNCDGFYGCVTLDNYHSLRDHTLYSLFGQLARICTKVYVHFFKFSKLFYFTAHVVDICDFSTELIFITHCTVVLSYYKLNITCFCSVNVVMLGFCTYFLCFCVH